MTGHHAPDFAASGQRLAFGEGGAWFVVDLERKSVLKSAGGVAGSHGPAVALSPDGVFPPPRFIEARR